MKKALLVTLLSIATFSISGVPFAQGKGGGGGGNGGGHPSSGMPSGSKAVQNSNGIRSLDRDKGLERAAERRNSHSLNKKHGKAKLKAKKPSPSSNPSLPKPPLPPKP